MKLNLEKIIQKFNLEVIHLPVNFLKDNTIDVEDISTGHYEMWGHKKSNKSILVFEENDNDLFTSMNVKEKQILFDSYLSQKAIIIIVSKKFNYKLILDCVKNNDFILLKSDFLGKDLKATIVPYIVRKNSKVERIHGCLVNIFGEGVLICGNSGIGKSELTLDLIKNKHFFIADDAVDIYRFGDSIYGKSAKETQDFLEARGIGLINVRKMYGLQSIIKSTKIDVIIKLLKPEENKQEKIERLGEIEEYETLIDLKLPIIKIPIVVGRNILPTVESAIISIKQKKYENYVAYKDLDTRLKKVLQQKKNYDK